jgi:hypothetical protein
VSKCAHARSRAHRDTEYRTYDAVLETPSYSGYRNEPGEDSSAYLSQPPLLATPVRRMCANDSFVLERIMKDYNPHKVPACVRLRIPSV